MQLSNFGTHHKVVHGSSDNLALLINAELNEELPFEMEELKNEILMKLKDLKPEIRDEQVVYRFNGEQQKKVALQISKKVTKEPFKNITNQLNKKGSEFH